MNININFYWGEFPVACGEKSMTIHYSKGGGSIRNTWVTAGHQPAIDDSEEPVRTATGKLRQKVFEKALQMKMDAAAAVFSPTGRNKNKK